MKSTKQQVLDRIDFLADEVEKEADNQISENLKRVGFEEIEESILDYWELEITGNCDLLCCVKDNSFAVYVYGKPIDVHNINTISDIQTFINFFKPKK